MIASLSNNTIQQYDTCLKKWFRFCFINHFNVYETSIPNVINFLTDLFNSGAQYGTINSCRSALALILGKEISNDDHIRRFIKGTFRLRPPQPRYNLTWDASLVLNYLGNLYPNEGISLKILSTKLLTLLALVTAHRLQTLSKIKINNIQVNVNEIVIKIPDLIKTSRPGSSQPLLVLPFFLEKPQVCPCKTLTDYLRATNDIRGSVSTLFISFRRPHRAVTAQTLSRWIKDTLSKSGVDISIFSAHSTRHAATSLAHKMGVNLDVIRNTAGWSHNTDTFAKFYNRHITDKSSASFARNIISNFKETNDA